MVADRDTEPFESLKRRTERFSESLRHKTSTVLSYHLIVLEITLHVINLPVNCVECVIEP